MENSKAMDLLTRFGLPQSDNPEAESSSCSNEVANDDPNRTGLLRAATEFKPAFDELMSSCQKQPHTDEQVSRPGRVLYQVDSQLYEAIKNAGLKIEKRCSFIMESLSKNKHFLYGRDRALQFGYKRISNFFLKPAIMDFLHRLNHEFIDAGLNDTKFQVELKAVLNKADQNKDCPQLDDCYSLYDSFDEFVEDSVGNTKSPILVDSKRLEMLGESLRLIYRLLQLLAKLFPKHVFRWCALCFRRIDGRNYKYCSLHSPKRDQNTYRKSVAKLKRFRQHVPDLGSSYLDKLDSAFYTYQSFDRLFNEGRVRVIKDGEEAPDLHDQKYIVIKGDAIKVDLTRSVGSEAWADVERKWFCFVEDEFPYAYNELASLKGQTSSWQDFLEKMREIFSNQAEKCTNPYWVLIELNFIENFLEFSEMIHDKKRFTTNFIIRLIEEGKEVKEIMRLAEVSKTYVYNVLRSLGRTHK